MYTINFRHDLNLLDIAWSSQFTPEAVADYARDLNAQFLREGFKTGYLLRIDMSASAVQPQDALPAFREHLGDFPKAERIAIVIASTIGKLQVQRVMTQPYLRIFESADESLKWLLKG